MIYQILLPWPDKALSPNARVHWGRKAKATKAARSLAFLMMRRVHPTLRVKEGEVVALEFVFIPPNLRRYDDDGLATRMKAARDGIADYLQVDDHRFRQSHRLSTVPTPGGQVIVKLKILPAAEIAEDSTT